MAKSRFIHGKTAGKWLSPEERRALGRSRRKQAPRQQHGQWQAKLRTQGAAELLRHSMHGRVPSLIALKYERMAASPFGYFRGAVPVMAADLSQLPHAGIYSQLCGDAHVSNLGSYLGADGVVVFDINDFDETIPGPFEWDLKRLAASLILAGRNAGACDAVSEEAVRACFANYTRLIGAFSKMSILDAAHYRVHRLDAVKPVADILRMAARATPQHSLEHLTERSSRTGDSLARRRFRHARPDLWRVTGEEAAAVLASLGLYRQSLPFAAQHFMMQYRPVDVAFKVVGTGSVGLRDYVVLFEGNGSADPLFLQIKEEADSGYAPYLQHHAATRTKHNGQRVAEGQQMMQLQSDPFLGWTQMRGRDYLVRQLNDHKAAIDITKLKGQALVTYAEVCGELLARGHARSGDACQIEGYIGSGGRFGDALLRFALRYADQTEIDCKKLAQSKGIQ